MTTRIVAASALIAIFATACSGGAGQRQQRFIPPAVSGPSNVTSLPPPASVHFTALPARDGGFGIIIGSDGAVYTNGGFNFVRFSGGSFTYYPYTTVADIPINGDAQLSGIASTSDGAIFATTFSLPPGSVPFTSLTRLLPASGTVATQAIITASLLSFIGGIARGPDGNIWLSEDPFDEDVEHNIGFLQAIQSDFSFVGGASPHPDGEAQGAIASAFGRSIFSASYPGVDGQHRIYQFAVPGGRQVNSWPIGADAIPFMTMGPDASLWFTDDTQNAIGRITPRGALNFFPVPTANAGLGGIAPASDNALWFTEHSTNKIGRIALDGSIKEYALPGTVRGPGGISGGAPSCLQGTLYFTMAGGIARLTF